MEATNNNQHVLRLGFYSAVLLTVFTVISFVLGMMAVPPAGPYCPGDCMEYPYLNSLDHYPHDYYWMYVSVFQLMIYLVFMISVYFAAPPEKKIYGFIGVALAIITVMVLLADYFVQFTVVPVSLMKGETDGIALLTQYNGNGLFIALEELGYILMGLSFLCMAPLFSKANKLELALRRILALPVLLILLFFLYYAFRYGIERSYRFEVAAIGVDWMALIVVGILAALFFKNKLHHQQIN